MKPFQQIALLLLIPKIEFLFGWESQILGRDRRKGRVRTGKKNCHFPGNQEKLFQFCHGMIESPLLHILNPNYRSVYLKCLRKCQKTYNFDIFQTVSQICTSPPPKFWGGSKIWSPPPMCILSKLHYEKFGVSNLFFSKVIEERPLRGRLDPHLVQEGLKCACHTHLSTGKGVFLVLRRSNFPLCSSFVQEVILAFCYSIV